MISHILRTSVAAGRMTSVRQLTPMKALSSYGLRSVSTRPSYAVKSLYSDKGPYESMGTAPEVKPSLDYFNEIMIDHNNFRDLHERFIAAYKDKDAKLMDRIANTLVYEVSVHSDGEELSVYKALDSHGLNSEANEDREIHGRMRRAFAEIDSNSTTSMGIDEFHAAVTDACRLLFSHVEDEEKVHFQKLSSVLTVEERGSLAVDFLRAREMAPGRPHPAAPQTGGVSQKLAGAMVKPVDAAVNSLRTFVEVKYKHADPKSGLKKHKSYQVSV